MAKKIREFVVSKTAPETSNVVWVEPKNKGYEAKILGTSGWTPITGLSEEESENLPSCISLGSMMIPDDESKAFYNGNIIKDFILNKKPFDLEGKTFYVDLGGYVNVDYPMNIMNGKLLFKSNISQGFTVQNGWSLNMSNVYVEWLSENNYEFRLFTNPSVDFYIPQIIIDHCSFINLTRTIGLTGIDFNPQEIKLGIGKVYFNDSVWKNDKHFTQNTLSNFIVYDLFILTNNYAENYIVWVNAGYTNEYNFYKSDYALDLMAEAIIENNVFDGGVYNTGTSVTSYHTSVVLEVDVVYFRKNHVKRCISIKENDLIDGEINGSHTFVLYCNKVYCENNIIDNVLSFSKTNLPHYYNDNTYIFKSKEGVWNTEKHHIERHISYNIVNQDYQYFISLGLLFPTFQLSDAVSNKNSNISDNWKVFNFNSNTINAKDFYYQLLFKGEEVNICDNTFYSKASFQEADIINLGIIKKENCVVQKLKISNNYLKDYTESDDNTKISLCNIGEYKPQYKRYGLVEVTNNTIEGNTGYYNCTNNGYHLLWADEYIEKNNKYLLKDSNKIERFHVGLKFLEDAIPNQPVLVEKYSILKSLNTMRATQNAYSLIPKFTYRNNVRVGYISDLPESSNPAGEVLTFTFNELGINKEYYLKFTINKYYKGKPSNIEGFFLLKNLKDTALAFFSEDGKTWNEIIIDTSQGMPYWKWRISKDSISINVSIGAGYTSTERLEMDAYSPLVVEVNVYAIKPVITT